MGIPESPNSYLMIILTTDFLGSTNTKIHLPSFVKKKIKFICFL
jgi:hypothetical protein